MRCKSSLKSTLPAIEVPCIAVFAPPAVQTLLFPGTTDHRLPLLSLQDQQHLRYVGSFKRQFMEQETRSLKERIVVKPGSDLPECICLVAVEPEGSGRGTGIMGTLDAEPPSPSPSRQHRDIPEVRGLTHVLIARQSCLSLLQESDSSNAERDQGVL